MLVCFKLYVKNAKTTAVRYLHEGLTVSDKLLREAKIEERIATLKQEKIFFNNQYLYYTKITPKSHRFQHIYVCTTSAFVVEPHRRRRFKVLVKKHQRRERRKEGRKEGRGREKSCPSFS